MPNNNGRICTWRRHSPMGKPAASASTSSREETGLLVLFFSEDIQERARSSQSSPKLPLVIPLMLSEDYSQERTLKAVNDHRFGEFPGQARVPQGNHQPSSLESIPYWYLAVRPQVFCWWLLIHVRRMNGQTHKWHTWTYIFLWHCIDAQFGTR